MTTNSFGVVGPTVTVTIRTVCYAISEHLLPKYIHLPQDKPSLERLIGWLGAEDWVSNGGWVQLMERTSPSCNHTATHKIITHTK